MNKIPKSLTGSIDVKKIDKSLLIPGKTPDKGPYLNLRLANTPDSGYGDDYLIAQVGPKGPDGKKAEGPILGNARAWDIGLGSSSREQSPGEPEPQSIGTATSEDLPF